MEGGISSGMKCLLCNESTGEARRWGQFFRFKKEKEKKKREKKKRMNVPFLYRIGPKLISQFDEVP